VPQIILEKKKRPHRRVILGAAVAVVCAGFAAWTFWPRPVPPKPKHTVTFKSSGVYSAPITKQDIQTAHQDVTVEGKVSAVTATDITIVPIGSKKALKLSLTPSTVFTKTALYKPADGKDIKVGENTQILYNNASTQALKVSYGF
jgi:hypothetical protein